MTAREPQLSEEVETLLDNDLFIWGLFARLLGLTYLVFFCSLFPQMAGLNRIYPIEDLLERVRLDIPALRRYLYFPTLSWVLPGTWGLKAIGSVGILASILICLDCSTPLFFFVAWLMALSLVTSMGEFVSFVWDRLLLEAGFLAMFLPPLQSLPDTNMAAIPSRLLSLAFTLLLFRVMFGMGKYKFFGPWRRQPLYIKWFHSFQPLPTKLAYFAFKLPNFIHVLCLYGMYLAEVWVPFLLFTPVASGAALTIALLQVGIWLSGNFGIFNLLTAILCLPAMTGGGGSAPLWHLLPITVAILGGLLYLEFNTWNTNMWMYLDQKASESLVLLKPVVDFFRVLHPFHIANSYGIFETEEAHDEDLPGLEYRRVLVIEGSDNGEDWLEYIARYQTCQPEIPPRHFAPHQPRIDHNLYYEAWNCRFSNINLQNPYSCGQFTWLDRLVQRLLEGDGSVESLFAHNPFPERPPRQIRVKRYNVRFTTSHERADTGHWYVREFYEMKLEPVSLLSDVFSLPSPREFAEHHHWWRAKFCQVQSRVDKPWAYEELIERRSPGRLNLAGRHLILRDGCWRDALCSEEYECQKIKKGSMLHRRLQRRFPELKAYRTLPHVILNFRGRTIEIGPTGERAMSEAKLNELFQ